MSPFFGFGFALHPRRNHNNTGDGGKMAAIDFVVGDDSPLSDRDLPAARKAYEAKMNQCKSFRSMKPGSTGLYKDKE